MRKVFSLILIAIVAVGLTLTSGETEAKSKSMVQKSCTNWTFYQMQIGPNGEEAYQFKRTCCDIIIVYVGGQPTECPTNCTTEWLNLYPN